MSQENQPQITVLGRDTTLVWPCRAGDVILWMRCSDILSDPPSIQIPDFWEMHDGYRVTITNRLEDLPLWFELHPTEVCNSFMYRLMTKIEARQYPLNPMDGPNLWRLRSGDRLAWVGAERPQRPSVTGILSILECRECALAIGEGALDIEGFIGFGSPSGEIKTDTLVRCRAAVDYVEKMGLPRTWGPEWHLG